MEWMIVITGKAKNEYGEEEKGRKRRKRNEEILMESQMKLMSL